VWEGVSCPPICSTRRTCELVPGAHTKVVVLEKDRDIGQRALSLFTARAQRAVGLRGEVNIRVTSSEEMRELNRRFRRKNQPTDVLSFPSALPQLAGDIAISGEIATSNAAEGGHSRETELKILILHGLLHLAGYDHEKDDGEMRTREHALRQRFNLPCGLIERVDASKEGSPRASRRPVAHPRRKGSRR